MKTHELFLLAAITTIGVHAMADGCANSRPPVRSIDRTCLPAPGGVVPVPLFRTDVTGPYQEIAILDSFTAQERCADTVKAQLKDVQAKGQAVGADAVIRMRPLSHKVRGLQEDPYTPFFSLRQGESEDHFFRATAIKYIGRRARQGQPIIAQSAAPSSSPALIPSLPGIDGGLDSESIFKTRTRRDDPINPLYEEDTVPQFFGTQTIGPR